MVSWGRALNVSGILQEKTAVSSARFLSIALCLEAARPGARWSIRAAGKMLAIAAGGKWQRSLIDIVNLRIRR
jgi:hypothetical protein